MRRFPVLQILAKMKGWTVDDNYNPVILVGDLSPLSKIANQNFGIGKFY